MTTTDRRIQAYQVTKVCTSCGDRWTGNTFREPTPGQGPTPGKCPRCIERRETDLQRILNRPRAVILTKAQPTADQDQPYPKLRRA